MHSRIFPRRSLLKGMAGAASMTLLGPPLGALAASPHTHALNDRLTLITGLGGNVVLYRGDSGLTLIDSGHPAHTQALLDLVDKLAPGAPIQYLFNTHWHEEHSGGNEALRARGADILAHENTRLWMSADFHVEWRQTHHKARSIEALPNRTFYDSGSLDLGGERVDFIHPPQAHTDGDLFLFFPVHNIMVAGGLLSHYRYPISDIASGGWLGGLLSANAEMLALANDDTLIVPDSGPALGKRDLQAQHDMLADLYEQMRTLMQMGYSGHDMLKAGVTAAYDERWGEPDTFVLETYRGMWAHTYDMGGFI